jgi:hypothetical protein
MVMHLVAYHEALSGATPLSPIDAVPDETVTYREKDIQVTALNQVVMAAVAGAYLSQARLNSPSLRALIPSYIAPAGTATGWGVPMRAMDLRSTPIGLTVEENLNVEVETTGASSPYAAVEFSDGPVTPVTGKIVTVRATGSTTLVADEWTNVPLEFDVDLPAGDYQIVGMRAESAGCWLARLVLKGSAERPGVLGCHGIQDPDFPMFRYGQPGIMGTFKHNVPPSVEFLSASADTSEVVYLDLIKIA